MGFVKEIDALDVDGIVRNTHIAVAVFQFLDIHHDDFRPALVALLCRGGLEGFHQIVA